VEGLLNEKAGEKFLENYTEFQVASALVNYVSPIALDPLATDETYLQSNNNRPRTPDFGIQLPDGDVFLEVTLCYANILDEWDKSGHGIRAKIEKLVFTTYKSRDVSIELPLKHSIDSSTLSDLLCDIEANENGSFPIGSYGVIQWKPIPYDPMMHPVCRVGRNMAPLSEEENELLVNAVKNTYFCYVGSPNKAINSGRIAVSPVEWHLAGGAQPTAIFPQVCLSTRPGNCAPATRRPISNAPWSRW